MPLQRAGLILSVLLLAAAPAIKDAIKDAEPVKPAPAPDIEGQSTIKVNVSLVDVPVSVTNLRGQFVNGLAPGNFHVFEDGRPQKITSFENEDIPVTVGLVVDHSGSMSRKLPEVSAAALAFAKSSNPKDEMFVVDFNDIVSLELPAARPFTSDLQQLEKAVSGVKADGRTAINDAILIALDQLRAGHRDRQSLIIVSDGGDNASKHKFAEVMSKARASKASIYTIGIFGADQADQNPGMLEKLAKATGGEAYFPRSASEVSSICTQIARDIREQYLLAYSPSNTDLGDSFRKIEVKVDSPNHEKLHVRTRAGYAPSPKGAPAPVVGAPGRS
jgi:Ca-activated chloride channel family protein